MATWKKVIVSGSDAIFNSSTVGTNQVITTSQSTTKLTGSFTGSFVGDGTGITGITATGLNIPGTVFTITDQPFVVSGSAALQKISLSDVLNQITGSGDGGLKKSGSFALQINTGSAHFQQGVSKEVFDSANFVDSTYIDFTVTAGTSVTAVISSGSIQNGHLANSAVTIGSTSVSLGNTATSLTGLSSVFAQNITASSNISASGALIGDTITGSNALISQQLDVTQIEVGNPIGNATAGQIVTANGITIEQQGLTVQAGGLNITDDALFNNNVTITGDLTVNGTTTTINTQELLIEDKFALFASGSLTATDGGIIVQATSGSNGATGFAYGYENTADRWVYQDGLHFTSASFGTPTAYAVSAEFAASGPSAAPAYGGASYGYGNIHVNTSTGEIFIYS